MKIILKQDVLGLGYKDEILTVKDGYGRNYLLPKGLAVLATPKAEKALAEELKQRAHKIAKIKSDAEATAKRFEGVSLTLQAKVSEGRNIYGSIGAPQLAEALAAQGLEVHPKQIAFRSVKELGNYTATINFHREVSVEIPFSIVNENGEVAPKKEKPAPVSEAEAEPSTEVEPLTDETVEAEESTAETAE
mgnify:CR=1 FL=1